MKIQKIIKKVGIFILCVLINLVGKYIASRGNFPLWLDTTGTCVAAYFLGPAGAVLTGVANNVLFMFWEKTEWVYLLVSALAALAFSFCAKKGYLDEFSKAAVSSFWVGSLCMVVSTPINLLLYEGYSGNMWGDALFDMLDWYGCPKVLCALADEAVVEIVDKQLCVLLAYVMIHLGLRLQKAHRKRSSKTVLSLCLAGTILMIAAAPVLTVDAEASVEDNFLGNIYNNRTGMPSSEANVIAETDDGYIWIGSYAGLNRYDGNSFEFIREGGITNVTCMMKDSQGRLWIGTNDSGIARYENGEFTFFVQEDGVPSSSIRCFAEADNGIVYVGTTDRICSFDAEDRIEIVDETLTYVVALTYYNNSLIAVDNNGDIHGIRDGKRSVIVGAGSTDDQYTYVTSTHYGLTAGTRDNEIHILEFGSNGIRVKKSITLPVREIVMMMEDGDGNIWICAETNIGYLDQKGQFHEQRQEGFDASFEWIHEDYQGNIWVASSRYGILKLSESQFTDLFAKAGVSGRVANAVTMYQGKYYCATDQGLVILDKQFKPEENELTELLAESRIRCLYVDSVNQLWICCYSDRGLVRYDEAGNIETYTMETKQTTSDRFRCVAELSDGTIVVGTADGINYIQGDSVVGTIRKQDGLQNSQILTLVQGEDGVLYAGSDGGGIYVIKDRQIVQNYSVEDGLSSNVILRMVPYDGGYFIVTSNALCYMQGSAISVLREFPYFNNYDILLDGENAYVLSSAGIYEVNAQELKKNSITRYRLYRASDGLVSGLTANSWNFVDGDGRLVFCCNSGITFFSGLEKTEQTDYLFDLKSIVCDGQKLSAENDVYTIPHGGKRVVISPSVRNYSLADVKVCFFVKGLDEGMEVCSYQDLDPIQITNIPSGDYEIHFQIWDSAGENVSQEKVYILHKEKQIWEQAWYWIYLLCVCVEIIAFTTWTIVLMVNISRRKTELEKQRKELQQKVEEQTEKIRYQQEKTEELFLQTVIALSEAVDAKDRYTSGHSKRVATYSKMLAARMGKSEEEQEEIYSAGLLHDVGKIRIPEEVINKPGKLTDKEFELIKIHPVTGYHILKGISENKMIAQGAKFHHERYDGKGYPNGLQGENIPEIARIIAVADAYDAMASNRSYRNALPQEVVRSEIESGRGTQFDPDIARIMLELIDEDMEYTLKQTEAAPKTVLIVDDEIMNIKLAEHVMKEESGYKLISATSGRQAIELVKKEKVDLILLDIRMPEMDGFETLQCIREIDKTVPVVFLSADRDFQIIQRAEKMGVDDYLTKPFLPLALTEVVRSMTD